ncbi:hypothetical protein RINTU1_31830 [Candidatus Regiella insecticola]|uniref:Uncharacterized protein n=1 Tax=Candidatus Regiella insecticola TaxID=138073 RepID=A0A6L2ZSQ2_9ENTR|nr:hypothetical protein RINTU1_31830 [Candidatus Regiella insecticola]
MGEYKKVWGTHPNHSPLTIKSLTLIHLQKNDYTHCQTMERTA